MESNMSHLAVCGAVIMTIANIHLVLLIDEILAPGNCQPSHQINCLCSHPYLLSFFIIISYLKLSWPSRGGWNAESTKALQYWHAAVAIVINITTDSGIQSENLTDCIEQC